MLTIWCCAIRPLPSVNGIVKTSGRVPAARAAVKVGAVQLYSCDSTVIQGYFASNSLIWRLSASAASCVAPGRRTPAEIVTGFWSALLGAAEGFVLATALASGAVEALGELVDALHAPRERMVTAATASIRTVPLGCRA